MFLFLDIPQSILPLPAAACCTERLVLDGGVQSRIVLSTFLHNSSCVGGQVFSSHRKCFFQLPTYRPPTNHSPPRTSGGGAGGEFFRSARRLMACNYAFRYGQTVRNHYIPFSWNAGSSGEMETPIIATHQVSAAKEWTGEAIN